MVVPRDQVRVASAGMVEILPIKNAKALPSGRSWLNMSKPLQNVYYNPLARKWNSHRESQVYDLLSVFHKLALKARLPADKLYFTRSCPMPMLHGTPNCLPPGRH